MISVRCSRVARRPRWRWQWLNGTTWTTIGTTYSDTAGVFFTAATMLRFLPAANYSGTPGALTAKLVDASATALTNGEPANVSTSGGVTPFSAANVVLGTNVSAAIALQP